MKSVVFTSTSCSFRTKTYVRRTREAIAAGDKEAAEAALRIAGRKLDKVVSKGVIHANQAAQHKSKLAKQVNAI